MQCMVAGVCGFMAPFMALAQETRMKDPHPIPSGYVMRFERTGGYAGVHDSFWIYPDGQVINAAGKKAKIPPDIVTEWLKSLTPAAASDAFSGFPPRRLCMDCFAYRITIYDRDETRILQLSDPLKNDPDAATKSFVGIRDRLSRLFRK